jgi:hypothetical protein
MRLFMAVIVVLSSAAEHLLEEELFRWPDGSVTVSTSFQQPLSRVGPSPHLWLSSLATDLPDAPFWSATVCFGQAAPSKCSAAPHSSPLCSCPPGTTVTAAPPSALPMVEQLLERHGFTCGNFPPTVQPFDRSSFPSEEPTGCSDSPTDCSERRDTSFVPGGMCPETVVSLKRHMVGGGRWGLSSLFNASTVARNRMVALHLRRQLVDGHQASLTLRLSLSTEPPSWASSSSTRQSLSQMLRKWRSSLGAIESARWRGVLPARGDGAALALVSDAAESDAGAPTGCWCDADGCVEALSRVALRHVAHCEHPGRPLPPVAGTYTLNGTRPDRWEGRPTLLRGRRVWEHHSLGVGVDRMRLDVSGVARWRLVASLPVHGLVTMQLHSVHVSLTNGAASMECTGLECVSTGVLTVRGRLLRVVVVGDGPASLTASVPLLIDAVSLSAVPSDGFAGLPLAPWTARVEEGSIGATLRLSGGRVASPLPDLSMPFNAICLAAIVAAFNLGGLCNLCLRKK